jgi:hypothetical protein
VSKCCLLHQTPLFYHFRRNKNLLVEVVTNNRSFDLFKIVKKHTSISSDPTVDQYIKKPLSELQKNSLAQK